MVTLLVKDGYIVRVININGFWKGCGMVAVVKGKIHTFGLNVDFDSLSFLFRIGKELSMHVYVL